MNLRMIEVRYFLFPLLTATVFVAACVTLLFLPLSSGRSSSWKGYDTLVVDAGLSGDVLTEALSHNGYRGVITSDNARVEFNDITRMESVPISQIGVRFDPVDPRIDPYMQRVGEYFETSIGGKSMRIAYIPAAGAGAIQAFALDRRLHRILDRFHVQWMLVEWNFGERLIFSAIFLVVCAAIVGRTRSHRSMIALSAFPWMLWVFLGGYAAFVPASILYFAWAFVLEEATPAWKRCLRYGFSVAELRSAELRMRLYFGAFALVVAILLEVDLHGVVRSVAPLATAGVATLALGALYATRLRRNTYEHDHPPYIPVRILRVTVASATKGSYTSLVPFLVALVLAPPIVMFLLPVGSDLFVPRPVAVSGVHGHSFKQIERLWEQKQPGALPDLSDFLTHRAFQDAFLYHRDYAFPAPGEQVMLSNFDTTGGKYTRDPQVALEFSDNWFRSQLRTTDEPARLLLAQPDAVRVQLEPVARMYSDYSTLVRNSVIVFLVFSPFLLALLKLGMRFRHGMREILIRRRRLEA